MTARQLLPAVCVIGFCVALMAVKFTERDYRDDEGWWVHIGWQNSVREVTWLSVANTSPPAYGLLLAGWQALHGHLEATTRYLSGLLMLLALALTYRLGADLWSPLAGLWATFLFGTLPVVQYYGYEARSYGLLLFAAGGSHLFLLRRLRTPQGYYGLLYVVFGILVTYTHYFGVYLIIGQAVATLVVTRGWRALRAFGLFVGVGAAFGLGWGVVTVFTFTNPNSGGAGTFPNGWPLFAELWTDFAIAPADIGAVVLLLAVFGRVSANGASALRTPWRKTYLVGVSLMALAVAMLANSAREHVNTRNLLVMLPTLPVLIGGYLATMRGVLFQGLVALMILIPAMTHFRVYDQGSDYGQLAGWMTYDGEPVVVESDGRSQHILLGYYLRERVDVAPEAIFHIFEDYTVNAQRFPHPPVHIALDDGEFDAFVAFVNDAPRLYYFRKPGSTRTGQFHVFLDAHYSPAREIDIAYEITLTEYVRNNDVEAPVQ